MMDLSKIRLLILDVDGVLTDGRLVIGPEGELAKPFHARDGYAIRLWQKLGNNVAILTGRSSQILQRRAAELQIECVMMGAADKKPAFEKIISHFGCPSDQVAYVGDDYPDLPAMLLCGFPVAVGDASPELKRRAQYVTRRKGGRGAVAEVVELLLRKQGRWSSTHPLVG